MSNKARDFERSSPPLSLSRWNCVTSPTCLRSNWTLPGHENNFFCNFLKYIRARHKNLVIWKSWEREGGLGRRAEVNLSSQARSWVQLFGFTVSLGFVHLWAGRGWGVGVGILEGLEVWDWLSSQNVGIFIHSILPLIFTWIKRSTCWRAFLVDRTFGQ